MRTFQLTVCMSCWLMSGSECHTQGCSFWMHDTPTPDLVQVLSECVVSDETASW